MSGSLAAPLRRKEVADGDPRVERLSARLSDHAFQGDLEAGLGARHVAATDNSIYEVLPAAIAYPARSEDINVLVRCATDPGIALPLTARGGNTGTNGQSLNGGVIVDCGRHLNQILSIDPDRLLVSVEPGVVLGQLNAALEPYGLFFPPTVSTASRATLGGMVATDASGKGSRYYGKTSDYIESLDVVLSDGSDWHVKPMPMKNAEQIAAGSGIVADIHREVIRAVRDHRDEIAATFPRMNRGLTGYNLQKTYEEERDRFFLAYLLAGSEGTLAITKAITFRVRRRPRLKAMIAVRYSDFQAGLEDVKRLLTADPVAIEILDDRVLAVAQQDIIWNGIESVLGETSDLPVRALNFIEVTAEDEAGLRAAVARLENLDIRNAPGVIDYTVVTDRVSIANLWQLREKCVGLLARQAAGRQGMPFVEDTAVPPERLPDFVAEFRALLDGHGLHYGMFGHADVGCLHVRPFMDMKDPAQRALIRPISDAVAALTKRYGGLLWGEHGRGFRGEYSPMFFGPTLYAALGRIKHAFDPANVFNPGKLASPTPDHPVTPIDAVPFRGERDGDISDDYMAEFERSVACNGNAACYSWNALDAMCPSYKATRDRAQSPKGRAALLRAWARLSSSPSPESVDQRELHEVEQSLAGSLSTCLSCKACTTLCPVQVDIPAMKSRFFARYYAKRARPQRDIVLSHLETLLGVGRRARRLANLVGQSPPIQRLIRDRFGLVDIPEFSPAGASLPAKASVRKVERLSIAERTRTIILVEDSFTSSFDVAVLEAAGRLLSGLGYSVMRLPARSNGKALHVRGFRARFEQLAQRRVEEFSLLARTGVRLVGLDAATSLMVEQEYREFISTDAVIQGIEDVLEEDIGAGRLGTARTSPSGPAYGLLVHCTEGALRPKTGEKWRRVLGHFGIAAEVKRVGCCGMAGMFGHEAEHLPISGKLFDLSWRRAIDGSEGGALVTGYSCRSQTMRMTGHRPPHPVELLASRVPQGAFDAVN